MSTVICDACSQCELGDIRHDNDGDGASVGTAIGRGDDGTPNGVD